MATIEDMRTPALEVIKAYHPKYQKYDNYYDGEHRLAFASEKFRNAFGYQFRAFADNLCATVVDATADRLTLTRFDSGENKDDPTAKRAWELWNESRMDRGSGQVHVEALKSGDAYLIVWPDGDNRPVFYPNRARGMTVGYDDETPGKIIYAAKRWKRSDDKHRLTMYYADRIEKYVTKQAHKEGYPDKPDQWEQFLVEGEGWPLENKWEIVPVFHFANNAGVGEWGRSELRDVIPLQDALNKAMADMMVAMEFNALRQRWATGLEVPTDPETGKPVNPFQPGGLWAVADKDVTFGEFDASNLTQFTMTHEEIRKEISVVSRTPGHYIAPLTGQWPSGESLKTAEASFLAKVRDRQVAFGNVWEDAMTLALRMAGTDVEGLSAVWEDATPRSDNELATRVQTLTGSGASIEGAARVAGYDDRDVEFLTRTDSVNGLLP